MSLLLSSLLLLLFSEMVNEWPSWHVACCLWLCCSLTRQRSKRITGEPFIVKEVVAVDMFPHTEHYELVMLLERSSSESAEDKKWWGKMLHLLISVCHVAATVPRMMEWLGSVPVTLNMCYSVVWRLQVLVCKTLIDCFLICSWSSYQFCLCCWSCFCMWHWCIVTKHLNTSSWLPQKIAIHCGRSSQQLLSCCYIHYHWVNPMIDDIILLKLN